MSKSIKVISSDVDVASSVSRAPVISIRPGYVFLSQSNEVCGGISKTYEMLLLF